MKPQTQAPVVAHTPLPWAVYPRPDTITSQHPDWQNSMIAKIATGEDAEQEQANAHFICLAVNSHAALVNAVQLALHRLDHRGVLADVQVDRKQYETALALAYGTKEVQS